MKRLKATSPLLKKETEKQQVLPQNREESPYFKAAMEMHKNAKTLINMPAKKHGLSPEEHSEKISNMLGRYNKFMGLYYGSVGHDYMKDLHNKRAKELMGDNFKEDYQSEYDVSHKQKMMEYAIKASENVVSETKDFCCGKTNNNDRIQRRLAFIQKALKQVNKEI